jgi:hypothetical protein
MSLHVEVYKVVFPMSVSECFLGTKKQPWLAEQNCSLNPRDTFSPEGLNILTLVVGLYKEQLCASGIPGCSPNRAVRERMPEVWPHCLLKSILSVASGGYRECSPSFYRVGKPKLRWGVGGVRRAELELKSQPVDSAASHLCLPAPSQHACVCSGLGEITLWLYRNKESRR